MTNLTTCSIIYQRRREFRSLAISRLSKLLFLWRNQSTTLIPYENKVGLLNLAEELGNVSQACKVMGLSRDTFYRYKEALESGGVKVEFPGFSGHLSYAASQPLQNHWVFPPLLMCLKSEAKRPDQRLSFGHLRSALQMPQGPRPRLDQLALCLGLPNRHISQLARLVLQDHDLLEACQIQRLYL